MPAGLSVTAETLRGSEGGKEEGWDSEASRAGLSGESTAQHRLQSKK